MLHFYFNFMVFVSYPFYARSSTCTLYTVPVLHHLHFLPDNSLVLVEVTSINTVVMACAKFNFSYAHVRIKYVL